MWVRIIFSGLVLFPVLAPAVSKEILELQRDLGSLREQVDKLERSLNDRLSALDVLVRQSLDVSSKVNTSVAVLDNTVRERAKEQVNTLSAPVASVGTKLDQMGTEFQALKESVTDLTARMGKIQQQLLDISNAVKTLPTPAAPPPGPGSTAGPTSANTPPVPAETLYQNALRDRSGGKLDLALQEFNDYVRYYGNTDLAPNAQFYIGDIHYNQGDLETSVKDFDAVLERYQDNNKTPDALYMKGQALVRMGKRTQGAKEFNELIRRFPRSDLAGKARAQLKALGLSASLAIPPASRGRRRRR